VARCTVCLVRLAPQKSRWSTTRATAAASKPISRDAATRTRLVTDQIKEITLHRLVPNIRNRRQASYRRSNPLPPGELVLIDAAPLDAYAVDPVTFRWARAQLSVAVDVFSRSLLAWRFTPASTKRVDAARLLYDLVWPLAGSTAERSPPRPPYVGIPDSVALGLDGESTRRQNVRFRLGTADCLATDRGRVDVSATFKGPLFPPRPGRATGGPLLACCGWSR
jgi:hypothetical protein